MYENIFAEFKGNISLKKYEDHFFNQTNTHYKEYLYDEYISKDKSQPVIADYLSIGKNTISGHLKLYEIRKDFKDKLDPNNVYNKTPSIVAEEQGRPFIEIYEELEAKGMSLTAIAGHLKIKSIGTLSNYVKRHYHKQELAKVDDNSTIIKGIKGQRIKVIEAEFRKQLGIEFYDFIKTKYIEERLSPNDLSLMLGIRVKTLTDYLERKGLSKTHEQARKDAIESGRMNYEEINRKGRNTRLKNLSRSGKQDMLRELIKYHSEELINEFPNIEIVTGYSEYSILTILEVDIPIIIFLNDKIYKIALEYDGDIWHKERKTDIDKYKMLAEKNLQLMRIEETNSTSTNLQILENEAKRIIKQIAELINDHQINPKQG